MPEPDMNDRVAVVTGGASGIGRATAQLLAEQGARVFVGDNDLGNTEPDDTNRQLFAKLKITQIRCDVRVEQDVRRLIEEAVTTAGRLDVLVNNAGVGLVKPITAVSEDEWDRVLDTNLKGAFFATKHAIPHMIAGGGGAIINIASNAGLLPRAHDPVYSISKAALVAMTKSLALCHSVDRIRINAVCPGPVEATRMMEADLAIAEDRAAAEQSFIDASPLARAHNRFITPAEVARAVLYLASDAAAMVTGTSIAIDGGKSLGVPPRDV